MGMKLPPAIKRQCFDLAGLPIPHESEEEFQAELIRDARAAGWLVYHTRDSRGSTGGFPDLVLVRGGRLVYAELKSATGTVSPDQEVWLDRLKRTASEVYVWRPSDRDSIATILA